MLTRRTFLRDAGLAGVAMAGSTSLAACAESNADGSTRPIGEVPPYRRGSASKLEASYDPKTKKITVNDDVVIRYSNCIGCYAMCGLRVKIDRTSGEILDQGGNPYNPVNAYPYLPFEAPLTEAYRTMTQDADRMVPPGTVCGRSLGNLDAYRQPDRITIPLKRAGKRGEGKWAPLSWDQLLTEVTEGGKLFEHLGEDRYIEGFKDLQTDDLLSEDYPELGSKRNGLVIMGGRTDGRIPIPYRFLSQFGTANYYSHHSS